MSTGLQGILRTLPGYQPHLGSALAETTIPTEPSQAEGKTTVTFGNLSDMMSITYETYAENYRAYSQLVKESLYNTLLHVTPEGYKTDFTDTNYGYLRRRLKSSSKTVREAVEMNPQIMHGNPVFRGTRIPIYQILEELADGTPLYDIPEGYPSLNEEQIQGGLDFAASILRIYDDQVSDR